MKKSAFMGIVTIILAAAIFIGIGSNWFKNWDVNTWFNGWGKGAEQTEKEPQEDNNLLQVTPSASKYMRVASTPLTYANAEGEEAYAENGVNLKVTITPASASNRKVDVTPAWVNGTSEWAAGKDVADYISITQATDGALDIAVVAKQPFAEQIKLTVTSRDNEELTVDVLCDYVKKAESFEFSVDGGVNPNGTNFTNTYTLSDVYTLDSEFAISKVYIQLAPEFWNAVKENIDAQYHYGLDYDLYQYDNKKELFIVGDELKFYKSTNELGFTNCFVRLVTDDDDSKDQAWEDAITAEINGAFSKAIQSYSGAQATLTVEYTCKHSFGVYKTEYKMNVNLDDSVRVKDMTVSDSNLYL